MLKDPRIRSISLPVGLIDLDKKIDEFINNYKKYRKLFQDEKQAWEYSFSYDKLNKLNKELSEALDILNKELERSPIEINVEKITELLDKYPNNPISKIFKGGIIKNNEKSIDLFSKILSEFFFHRLMFCLISLFYLSLISYPHAVKSRYPENNHNPLNVYNEEKPLIKSLDFFIKHMEKTLENLSKLVAVICQ